MTSYLVIIILFCVPVAVSFFAQRYLAPAPGYSVGTPATWVRAVATPSPFAAAFSLPLTEDEIYGDRDQRESPPLYPDDGLLFFAHVGYTALLNAGLLGGMIWLFQRRWRVAQ
jgi:hypothetical protein